MANEVDFGNVAFTGIFPQNSEATIQYLEFSGQVPLLLDPFFVNNRLNVYLTSGEMFGSQPFLAIETHESTYCTYNFDEHEKTINGRTCTIT